MSVKVFNSQIGHISSSFFKHVGVSKSLKWKFSWWPWTGSVFNFKKQENIKLSILISSLRCSPFRGYLYICRILLGSPSTTRWKTPKNLKRRIAGSVVDYPYGHNICVLQAFKGCEQRECRERRFSFLLKIVKVKKLIFWQHFTSQNASVFASKKRAKIDTSKKGCVCCEISTAFTSCQASVLTTFSPV